MEMLCERWVPSLAGGWGSSPSRPGWDFVAAIANISLKLVTTSLLASDQNQFIWKVGLCCANLPSPNTQQTFQHLARIWISIMWPLCPRPGTSPGEENKLFFGLRAAIKNNRNELLFQFHEYLKINDLDIFCRSQKLMNMQLVSSQRATNRVTPNNRPHLANKLQLQWRYLVFRL